MSRPHARTNFILGTCHPFRTTCLHIDRDAVVVTAVGLQPGCYGDVDESILRLSEDGSHFFGNAYYLELSAIHVDRLSQWFHVWKKALHHIHANETRVRTMIVVGVGDVASAAS